MFNFMLKHKKGFTLVELLVVMVLMGFGVVALANLFQSAMRTFNKTEERYIKQEMVKTVADYLQHSVSVVSATMADVYADSSVVPPGTNEDAYAYIYVEKRDLDGKEGLDGYYLYILNPGAQKKNAKPLNPDVPIYISIDVYEEADERYHSETDGKDYDVITNQCGVKFRIAAVDSDYVYKSDAELQEQANLPENAGKTVTQIEAAEIEDSICYNVDVSYHFPNMVAKSDEVRVNLTRAFNFSDTNAIRDAGGNFIDLGFTRTKANKYTINNEAGEETITTTVVDSVDLDGKVLRVATDNDIVTEGASTQLSVSSMCFIATAGFGKSTGEVGILCQFRDQCLKTNPLGRMFVKAYYTVSPPIADFIAEHETLKEATRVALKPLVAVAVYALEPELLVDQLPFIIMGIGSLGGIVAVCVVRRKKLRVEN